MENVDNDAMDIDTPPPLPPVASATDGLRETFNRSVRQAPAQPLRRGGVHRNLAIIIDGNDVISLEVNFGFASQQVFSIGGQTIQMRDLLPSRIELMLRSIAHFIPKFFEENPLSQLQLIQTSDAVAKIITPLSGSSFAIVVVSTQNCLCRK
jgi:hypothetical protein